MDAFGICLGKIIQTQNFDKAQKTNPCRPKPCFRNFGQKIMNLDVLKTTYSTRKFFSFWYHPTALASKLAFKCSHTKHKIIQTYAMT